MGKDVIYLIWAFATTAGLPYVDTRIDLARE